MSINEFEKAHYETEKESLGILRDQKKAELEEIEDRISDIEDKLNDDVVTVEDSDEAVGPVEEVVVEGETVEAPVTDGQPDVVTPAQALSLEEEPVEEEAEEEVESESEEAVEEEPVVETVSYDDLKVPELKKLLSDKEIDFDSNAKKADLIALLEKE